MLKFWKFFAVAMLVFSAFALSACGGSSQQQSDFDLGYNTAMTQMAPTNVVMEQQLQQNQPTFVVETTSPVSIPTAPINDVCTISKSANSIIVTEIGGGGTASVTLAGLLPTYDTMKFDEDRTSDTLFSYQTPNGLIDLVSEYYGGFFYVRCYNNRIESVAYDQIPMKDAVYIFTEFSETRYLYFYQVEGFPFIHTLTESEQLQIQLIP